MRYKSTIIQRSQTKCPVLFGTGRKTFPRARRTQAHGFRSPVNFSPTEQQSPSTSSGSSIFTPELEEPGHRRRGSDIEATSNPTLSVMDISPPSRCEQNTQSLLMSFFCRWTDVTSLFTFYSMVNVQEKTLSLGDLQEPCFCSLASCLWWRSVIFVYDFVALLKSKYSVFF